MRLLREQDMRLLLLVLALSVGFVAMLTFPLQLWLAQDRDCMSTGHSMKPSIPPNGTDMRVNLNDGAPNWVCRMTAPEQPIERAFSEPQAVTIVSNQVVWRCDPMRSMDRIR